MTGSSGDELFNCILFVCFMGLGNLGFVRLTLYGFDAWSYGIMFSFYLGFCVGSRFYMFLHGVPLVCLRFSDAASR